MLRQHLVVVSAIAAVWSAVPAGAEWSTDPTVNTPVCLADGFQKTFPESSVTDGFHGAIVVWVHEPTNPDIWAQRISAGGDILWSADGEPVCTAAGSQSEIRVVEDGAGGAIVVWRDHRGSDFDYWAQRIDGNGQVLWPVGSPSLDGVPVCTAAGDQESMEAVSDGAGGVIVVWRNDDSVDGGVYAQRLDADGQRLWPTGAPADAGEVVSNLSVTFDPSVTGDGSGGAIIAWADTRNNATTNFDIYAQRLNANGVHQWTADGVPVCLENYGQRYTLIVSDGSGGAVVAWQDYRTSGSFLGIYAQRLGSNGNILWTPEGVVINETIWSGDWVVGIAGDGSGGAYVVWVDVRADPDLYAQRLDAFGQTLWAPGGTPVVQTPENQSSFDLVSDGPHGVFVTWPDPRNGNFDIYAQHLEWNGAPTGPDNGVEVCTQLDGQSGPSAVKGGGGLIVTWYDARNLATTGIDVYGQLVFGDLPIFRDGFESGDTGAWDQSVP
jgi:hypothetical protein